MAFEVKAIGHWPGSKEFGVRNEPVRQCSIMGGRWEALLLQPLTTANVSVNQPLKAFPQCLENEPACYYCDAQRLGSGGVWCLVWCRQPERCG